MANKTPPFHEYPEWTTSRFFQFLRSALRKAFTRWPPKYKALERSKRTLSEVQRKRRKVRHTYEYKCSLCRKFYTRKEVEVDHKIPAGSLKSYEDLPGFVERMFVGEDKLQVVCKTCHRSKTKTERES